MIERSPIKIFTVWSSEMTASALFPSALHPNSEDPVSNQYYLTRLFSDKLIEHWSIPNKVFWKEKASYALPTIVSHPSLLLPKSAALQLFDENSKDLELLPEIIDGQPWMLVNSLRKCARFDDASSVANPIYIPGVPGALLTDFRWLNVVDPAAMEMDIFTMKEVGSFYFITERLVNRIQSLGLKGVEFQHVGYIVADASQVVLAPPAPPPAIDKSARTKRASKPAKLLELRKTDLSALQTLGALLRAELGLSDTEAVAVVLQRLTQHIETLRPKFIDLQVKQQLPDVLAQLSAVYGDLLVRECGWSYVDVSAGKGSRHYGLASPDRAHALLLAPFMRKQLESPAEVTLTLQLNMIKAGQLPPGGTAEAPVVLS